MEIALSKIEGDFEVKKEQGRVYVFCPENYDYDEAVDALQHVFGIVGICPVVIYEDQGFEQMAKDGTIDSAIRPIDSIFAQYPAVTAKPEYEKMLYNGNRMALSCFSDYRADGSAEPVRVYDWNGAFIGIYRIDDAGLTLKPVKIFME